MGISLPDDVILDIISRLPPKNAMQLCCMSKDWRSTLTSEFFRSLHFENFTRKRGARALIWRWKHADNHVRLSHFRNGDHTHLVACPRNCPAKNAVVGIIHGLVCLVTTSHTHIVNDAICVWNPIVKRKLTVPPVLNLEPLYLAYRLNHSVGFAHDHTRNEYKIFSIVTSCHPGWNPILRHVLLDVFSWSTGDWTRLPSPRDFRFGITSSTPPVFLEGSCHWAVFAKRRGDVRKKPYILCVRATDHSYCLFPLPHAVPMKVINHTYTAAIRGCLALIPCPSPMVPIGDSAMNVWVMKQYGDVSSWTMRYRIAGEVDTVEGIVERAVVLIISGTLFDRANSNEEVVDVMLCEDTFCCHRFSDSLELLREGEPCTCFCSA